MLSLFSQNWFVARKNLLIWIILTACALLPVLMATTNIVVGLGMIYPFLAVVYLSVQCTSGNLDTQVVAGFSRGSLFISHFAAILILCLIALALILAGDMIETLVTPPHKAIGWPGDLFLILGGIGNAAAYAALFTLIGMFFTGRHNGHGIVTLILSFILVFGMAAYGSILETQLSRPQMIALTDVMVDGQNPESILNPDYVGEPQRSLYEAILEVMSVTQAARVYEAAYATDSPARIAPSTAYGATRRFWSSAAILLASLFSADAI